MAVQPDTTTGTVTFTSGSVAFTTSGTNMLTRGHMPGDRFLRNGLDLQIATITGENTGTLTENCPAAAAGVGVAVRLRFQPDGSRVAAQTRNLIDLLGNGLLQALAALDGASGNKGVMLTGVGTADVFALTAAARSLLDDASVAAMRTTLGVSTPQTDRNDLTAGRGLIMGAFGLGGQLPTTVDVGFTSNFDVMLTGGMFTTTGSYTNGPVSNGGSAGHTGVLINLQRYTTGIYQIWMNLSTSRIFVRGFNVGDVGTAWSEVQISTRSGYTHKIVRGENNTVYTRSWTTAAAPGAVIGPTITVTPSSPTSILLISAYMRIFLEQTGTDNDVSGVGTFSYQNSGGTYVVFDSITGSNMGSTNGMASGVDLRGQIPIIGELSASQKNASGDWVIRPWFDPGDDGTAGFAATFSLQGCSWILTEITP